MSNDIWRRDEIESPCIQLCTIHPETRLCLGCARSIDEITAWSRMTPEARRAVMRDLSTREPGPKTRRGGRARRIDQG